MGPSFNIPTEKSLIWSASKFHLLVITKASDAGNDFLKSQLALIVSNADDGAFCVDTDHSYPPQALWVQMAMIPVPEMHMATLQLHMSRFRCWFLHKSQQLHLQLHFLTQILKIRRHLKLCLFSSCFFSSPYNFTTLWFCHVGQEAMTWL